MARKPRAAVAESAAIPDGSELNRALKVVYKPIDWLVPNARNARTHSDGQVQQIVASVLEFGWTNPVLCDETGDVIAGHGRLLAARQMRLADVPCLVLEGLSEAQKSALRIADNKLGLNAGWDADLLKLELADLSLAGFDLDLTGFSGAEILDLNGTPPGGRKFHTDPDDAPAVEAVAVSQLGDVWLLGAHRLVCGDCTAPAVAKAALGDRKPLLMVTDPPYGVNYAPGWRNDALRADGSKIGARATGEVLNDAQADWRRAWMHFPGQVAYVWHSGLHAGTVARSLEACRFQIRAQIVWVKQRLAISRGHYHWQHEPCLYAVENGADDAWRFIAEHEVAGYAVREGETAVWEGGRKQSTVWNMEHVKSDTGHGTQKPVEAMRRPILNNSVEGDAVYEPFSGSGTTIIAAEMTGRKACAIELNPAYVDVAVRRWQAFTGLAATQESDGRTFAEIEAERVLGRAEQVVTSA